MPENETVPLAIIGAGAAGCFAAAEAGTENGDGIYLFEGGAKPLQKVRISGGGRCNVTHACFDPKQLTENYPRGFRELRGPFTRFQPGDTIEWFGARGVELKKEEDGRMFPTTDQSQTIIDCLLQTLQKREVSLLKNQRILSLRRDETGHFLLERKAAPPIRAKFLLLAVGSLAASPLRSSLEALGHTLTETVPSLFTFCIEDPALQALAGLSLPEAKVTVPGFPKSQTGPILITHWGLSGPAVLKMSAWAARYLHQKDYHFSCEVQWVSEKPEALREKFKAHRSSQAKRQVQSACPVSIPRRLWTYLCTKAGTGDTTWAQLPTKTANTLIELLTRQTFSVTGKSTFKEEFVTCGGISLKEVNFRTMESRHCSNLFFAGECLDIDGVTGGFNFQAAWTTGYLAGQTLQERLKAEAVDSNEQST